MAKEKPAEAEEARSVVEWEERGSFPVHMVDGIFTETDTATAAALREATGSDSPRILLVADANVVQRTEGLGSRIGRYLQANELALASPPIVLAGGEKIKTDNLQSVFKVMTEALDARIGATDVVMALGGGTVLDVAGYAAAQVRGGLRLVRVPTTVAAMADAAFAQSACVDSANVKDALRIASRPAAVLIDTAFASTVLDGVWRGGLGEIVRHAAVRDAGLMERLAANMEAINARDAGAMAEVVRAAVASRLRNGGSGFALWSAARLEAMSGYKLPHGYAVAIGICIDCAYAVEKGYMDGVAQERVCRLLAECGALDCLAHSHHLLAQTDSVLKGLDAWRLATGSEARELPAGVGKGLLEAAPDRDAYRKVVKEFLSASSER